MTSSATEELVSLHEELTSLNNVPTDGITRDDALKLAVQCAELQMKFLKLAADKTEKQDMTRKCNHILAEAQRIKTDDSWQPHDDLLSHIQPLKPTVLTQYNSPSIKSGSDSSSYVTAEQAIASPKTPSAEPFIVIPKKLSAPLPSRKLPKQEQILLLKGSKLNNTQFPPWEKDPDASEFVLGDGQEPFTDPYEFRLSKDQREILDDWKRPAEAIPPPSWRRNEDKDVQNTDHMAAARSPDFVQDAAADCSVVASMCAGAARWRRGHARIISNIMYPFDTDRQNPIMSPNGKYIIRLNFNGCARKVVIDDRLPVSKTSRILHVVDRNNPNYICPALLEKAYLKMRGGYDFPGSNSATDLWIMTGWIPEQIFLDPDETDVEQMWSRVYRAFGYGDVLVTLGTGKISSKSETALGLASEHDYAVIDFKEVDGQKSLLIKNPWLEGGAWKSPSVANGGPGHDQTSSSTGLDVSDDLISVVPEEDSNVATQLAFDPHSPGTFWMDMETVMQHFESMYLNWNPGLFKLRQDFHFSWDLNPDTNPARSATGSCNNNPQYTVSSSEGGVAWFVLSRHFTNTAETGLAIDDSGFISLYAFASDGKRVLLSKGAIKRSAYIDSPQTLLRMDLKARMAYTIVVSEQDLRATQHTLTLSAFSNTPLVIDRAGSRYAKRTSKKSSWTATTAGGNASSQTYSQNPQFALQLPAPSPVALLVETVQPDLSVHVKVIHGQGERVYSVTNRDVVIDSGDYRRGCALAELIVPLDAGTYTVVCSTFEAGQLGDFRLQVESDVDVKLAPIAREGAGRIRVSLADASFARGVRLLAAPIQPMRMAKVNLKARYVDGSARHSPIRVTIELGRGPDRQILIASAGGMFSDAASGVRTEDVDLRPDMVSRRDMWLVLERLGGFSGEVRPEERICVEMFADALDVLSVGVWREWQR